MTATVMSYHRPQTLYTDYFVLYNGEFLCVVLYRHIILIDYVCIGSK